MGEVPLIVINLATTALGQNLILGAVDKAVALIDHDTAGLLKIALQATQRIIAGLHARGGADLDFDNVVGTVVGVSFGQCIDEAGSRINPPPRLVILQRYAVEVGGDGGVDGTRRGGFCKTGICRKM